MMMMHIWWWGCIPMTMMHTYDDDAWQCIPYVQWKHSRITCLIIVFDEVYMYMSRPSSVAAVMSRKPTRLTKDWWADWLEIDEKCWPAEWWVEINVHSRGWLCNRTIWFLVRRILHFGIGQLKPFLVRDQKTRLGLVMRFGAIFISWCWL